MKTALTIFLLATAGGFAALVAGVYLLAGTGWALIAGAMGMFAAAGFVRKGMTSA